MSAQILHSAHLSGEIERSAIKTAAFRRNVTKIPPTVEMTFRFGSFSLPLFSLTHYRYLPFDLLLSKKNIDCFKPAHSTESLIFLKHCHTHQSVTLHLFSGCFAFVVLKCVLVWENIAVKKSGMVQALYPYICVWSGNIASIFRFQPRSKCLIHSLFPLRQHTENLVLTFAIEKEEKRAWNFRPPIKMWGQSVPLQHIQFQG